VRLVVINGAYAVLGTAMMGFIVAAWTRKAKGVQEAARAASA
jgi:hypothetical protein